MANALLHRLTEKVRQAVAEIHGLRKEKERLEADVALMTEENRRARRLLREHGELIEERQRLRARIEKALSKLDKLRV
ncbi:MAG: cell division protein ZapB [Elusimicrobia bacterium]|nr:cell division protein ZapB [Elusimicrobiota bacterium]